MYAESLSATPPRLLAAPRRPPCACALPSSSSARRRRSRRRPLRTVPALRSAPAASKTPCAASDVSRATTARWNGLVSCARRLREPASLRVCARWPSLAPACCTLGEPHPAVAHTRTLTAPPQIPSRCPCDHTSVRRRPQSATPSPQRRFHTVPRPSSHALRTPGGVPRSQSCASRRRRRCSTPLAGRRSVVSRQYRRPPCTSRPSQPDGLYRVRL